MKAECMPLSNLENYNAVENEEVAVEEEVVEEGEFPQPPMEKEDSAPEENAAAAEATI